jgi:hypothetical protein
MGLSISDFAHSTTRSNNATDFGLDEYRDGTPAIAGDQYLGTVKLIVVEVAEP